LAEVWASTSALLAELTSNDWSTPSALPGWDVHDLVAHLVGTEAELLGDPMPDIDAVGNEAWVASLRSTAPEELTGLFNQNTARRLEMLRAMTPEQWDAQQFAPLAGRPYEVVLMIRVLDCWVHEQDIRDATGRPGNESGLAVDVTLDVMAHGMLGVVDQHAGAERGDSVTFALTEGGPVVREIHVAVDGLAQLVPALPKPATTTLTMPVAVMVRRAAGRVGSHEFREEILIEGDVAIAERVLANQSYMG
jgi:uncharacterized protein (TIGR03083 family)